MTVTTGVAARRNAMSIRRDVVFNEMDFGRQKMTRTVGDDSRTRDDRERVLPATSTWTPDLGEEEEVSVPALLPLTVPDDLQSEEEPTQADSPEQQLTKMPRDRIVMHINRRLLPSVRSDSDISLERQEEQEEDADNTSVRQEEMPRWTSRARRMPVRFGIDEYVSVLDEYAFAGIEICHHR